MRLVLIGSWWSNLCWSNTDIRCSCVRGAKAAALGNNVRHPEGRRRTGSVRNQSDHFIALELVPDLRAVQRSENLFICEEVDCILAIAD